MTYRSDSSQNRLYDSIPARLSKLGKRLMRDLENIFSFWQAHDEADLVLATIVRKQGSGYRAVGAKKIISQESACGLLSGGCLESEINWNARQAGNNLPLLNTFSTADDSVFGYQAGCVGRIDILFEKLPARTMHKNLYVPYGVNKVAKGVAVGLGAYNLGDRQFVSGTFVESYSEVLYEPWIEPVTLCIIGCGPDAPALSEMAGIMGWRVLLLDYRPDYVATGPATYIYPLKDIVRYVPEGERIAVILMTHNYEADLRILNGLSRKRLGYLGCLGPRGRFEQMKADLWTEFGTVMSPHFEAIVHAPAGLFSQGRNPEEIALAITSEIQVTLRHTAYVQPCPV